MESFLSRLTLFAGLSPADCANLEQRMPRRDFAPQSVIVREGTPADAAFVVLSGLASIRRCANWLQFTPVPQGSRVALVDLYSASLGRQGLCHDREAIWLTGTI